MLTNRIVHFSPSPTFNRKFLFNPCLNDAELGVYYFSIGQTGYRTGKSSLFFIAKEYLRSIVFLFKSHGETNKNTVAYCHTTKYAAPALLICRLFGVGRIIYFNHGVPYIGYRGLMRSFLHFLELLNVRLAHEFITVSPSMTQFINPLLQSNPYQCSTNPGSSSGLRESDFASYNVVRKLACEKPRLGIRYLYAGRLQARKGVFILLDAWRLHIAQFPHDELWLCGFDKSELTTHASLSKLHNLQVKGYVQNMMEIFSAIDVVVSPSFHEGFGYTLLEGAACGCCILSSAVPGPDVMFTPWMRNQLFAVGDVLDLTNVMANLSSSPKQLAIARLLSWRSARRFSVNKLHYPCNVSRLNKRLLP